MPEQFSIAYVSGDLGQALAMREGVALLFDGHRIEQATTGEINTFFDMSMDFQQLEPEVLETLDEASLSDFVRRQTICADGVRFLMFGLDRDLSDGLRLSSIGEAERLLGEPAVRRHVQERFLNPTNPDFWDFRAAAILAMIAGADAAALVYSALGNSSRRYELRSAEPESWPVGDVASWLAELLTGRGGPVRRPIWERAAEWLDFRPGPSRDSEAADWFVRRFGGIEMAPVRASVSHAMTVSAVRRFLTDNRSAVALQQIDNAIGHLPDDQGDRVTLARAIALACEAAIFARQNNVAAARSTNSRVIELLAGRVDGPALRWTAEAMLALAHSDQAAGNLRLAIEQYDRIASEFGRLPYRRIRIIVANAAFHRSAALMRSGEISAAKVALLDVERTIGEGGVRADLLLAKARYNLGCLSDGEGDSVAAINSFRRVVESCRNASDAERISLWQDSLYNMGTVYARVDDHRRAITSYREVLAAVGGSHDPDRRHLAIQATFNLALSLEASGDLTGAVSAYRDAIASARGNPSVVNLLRKSIAGRQRLESAGAKRLVEEAPASEANVVDLAAMFNLADDD